MVATIIRGLGLLLLASGLVGGLFAQTLTNLGSTAPTPAPNDISQLSTQGNKVNPDGLNYFTDNYTTFGNGEPGQTFTTGANAGGYVMTSLALKTGGIGSTAGTTTPQPYNLHIYSLSGNTATLLHTYTSGDVAFNDGNWLQWTGFSVSLAPDATYAFSFGKADSTSSYAPMAVATNKYGGGEIAQIRPNTGGVSYGGTHTFDAVFNLGLTPATTPTVSSILVSPTATVPAGVTTTFTASVAGALPMSYQWQFDDGSGYVDLPGANSTTLSFTTAVAKTGSYRLVLTNSHGTVMSAPAVLSVSPRINNIPDSMPFPLPTYGMNIGNKLELNWGAPNPSVLYNVAYHGFNAVRVPCAWAKNSTTSVVDGVTRYIINPGYMAQVKQTVDAAVDAGLYVMINCHADNNWLEASLTPDIDPVIDAQMKDYWTQIATVFADYDNHLLFAAANEPHVHSEDEMKVLVYYYQTFVNAVRATGGNNTNRWLVLQSVSDPTWMNALPTDTVPNRLMVEYHNYTPSLFSIIHNDQSWGTAIYFWGKAYHYAGNSSRNSTWGEESDIDAGYQQLADLYVSKGIPVMIGEFGASPSGLTDPTEKAYNVASVLYWDKYLAESARFHGLSPFYWSTGGDPFDYDTAANRRPDIIAAVTGGAVPPPPNGAPYAASGLTATGGTGQVTLSWTAGGGATSYDLYRATVSGGGIKIAPVVTGITGTSYTDTGLASGTTYYYQVVAVNASGMSGYSPQAKATTSGTAITDPAQYNFEATTQGWSGGGGIVSGVAISTVQKYAGNQSLAVNFSGTAGGTSSASVGNVAVVPGTTITFRVWIPAGSKVTLLQPYLQDNNWNWSSGWFQSLTAGAWNTVTLTVPLTATSPLQVLGVQFTTNAAWTGTCYVDSVSWPAGVPDFTLTADSTSLTVSGGTSGTSTITVNAFNSLNAAYTFSVDGLPAGVSASFAQNPIIGGSSVLTLTASDTVPPGTTNVSVIATAGLISHTTTIALTLTPPVPPAVPTNLVATPGDSMVGLAWSAANGATSYNIKRSAVAGGPYTTVANVTTTSAEDTGLVNGTTYYYVVSAVNAAGESANSAEVSATPSELSALYAFEGDAQDTSGLGNHGTANAISYVTGKVGAQAAQFNGTSSYVSIPRSVIADFTVAMWVKTTDTAGGAGGQWWSGKGLVDGEVGGGGADWGTSVVNGKFVLGIGSTSGDTTIASSVNINDGAWHHLAATRDNTTGAIALYVDGVLRGSGTGATGDRTFPPGLRIGSLQTGGGFLNGALDDVRLYSRVLSDSELTALAAGPLTAPQNLGASPGTAKITLSWSAVAGAADYTLRRSASVAGPFTQIATGITTTGYEDGGLADGATWYYTVSANGFLGAGAESAPVSATTFTDLENWRVQHFGTEANSADAADASDPDGDGMTNVQEYIAGTGPNDSASCFKITQFEQMSGDAFVMSFPSVLGRTYTVERSYTLESGSWVALPGAPLGTGETISITDTDPTESPRRFYRVVVTR